MEQKELLLSFLFYLILYRTSAIQTLRDINDLKNITSSMKESPRHGLMLLHWFANSLKIDSDEMQLNFDPGQGSYGSHCNKDTDPGAPFVSLESLHYFLGDLERGSARMFPFYVVYDFYHSLESSQKNLDRVLIQVQKSNPMKIEKVYITEYQRYHLGRSVYNLNCTYEISPRFLIQIQSLSKDITCTEYDPRLDFSMCEFLNQQQKANKMLRIYPKTPGLEWFLTLAVYNIDSRFQESFCTNNQTGIANQKCLPTATGIMDNNLNLEVKSTSEGYARITWSGIPENVARMKLKIGIFKDRTHTEPLREYSLDGRTYGTIDTSVSLNPGLQVQLFQTEKIPYYYFFRLTSYTTIWKGPELDEANRVPPFNIRGYQSSLQLYTKDGYACARLYIRKSFSNWKTVFNKAWVGFYTSPEDDNTNYRQYAWSTTFKKRSEHDCVLDYEIYQYESSVHIGPGVQVRFMLTKHSGSEKARTVPWEK